MAGGSFVMSSASSPSPAMIVPESGSVNPEIVSKSVVLPAPLGPMKPTISPPVADKETSDSARSPPNCLLTESSDNRIASSPGTASGSRVPFLPVPFFAAWS